MHANIHYHPTGGTHAIMYRCMCNAHYHSSEWHPYDTSLYGQHNGHCTLFPKLQIGVASSTGAYQGGKDGSKKQESKIRVVCMKTPSTHTPLKINKNTYLGSRVWMHGVPVTTLKPSSLLQYWGITTDRVTTPKTANMHMMRRRL